MKQHLLDKLLFTTLIIGISTIISFELIYFNAPEIFNGGDRVADILVAISLSYVAAYIFYFFTVFLPKKRERNQIKEHAAYLVNRILFYILKIMEDSSNFNIPQKTLKLQSLKESDFKSNMTGVFFDTPLKNFRAGTDGHNINVGLAVKQSIDGLHKNAEELFRYILYLDPELVALVSKALRATVNESWVNSMNIGIIHLGTEVLAPVRRDVSHYAKFMEEYQDIYRHIEHILCNEFKDTEVAVKHQDNIMNLKANK